jgi:hypothetical protein
LIDHHPFLQKESGTQIQHTANRADFYTQRPKSLRISGVSTLHRSTWLDSPNYSIGCFTSTSHSIEREPFGTRCRANSYSSMEIKFFETVSSNDIFHVPILMTSFPSNTNF